MGTDICLPVAKYSYATGLCANNTSPWSHVTSTSLFIIVKGTDKSFKDEKLMLRIVQGNEVLESLNVSAYIDKAVAVKSCAQSRGESISMQQLPIFGITKDSILALRYTMQENVSRRLQVRMRSVADLRQLLHAFETRGMVLTEQVACPARPDTARPLTMDTQAPMSSSTSANFGPAPPPSRRPFVPQVIEAGSLSQLRPHSPVRNSPSSHGPQAGAELSLMPPPGLITRDDTLAQRQVLPDRPSTAHISRSHTMQPQASHSDAVDVCPTDVGGGPQGQPMYSHVSAATEATNNYHPRPPGTAVDEQHVAASGLDASNGHSARKAENAVKEHTSYDYHSTASRPLTSSSIVFAPTIEHEIPPRRELPFAQPDSRRSGSTNSRPGSALALPPLPKPRLSNRDSTSASRPSSPVRPQSSSPLKRSFAEMSNTSSTVDRPTTASPQKTTAQARVPSPQAPAKKPSRMEQVLGDRRFSLEKPSNSGASANNVPRLGSLADAPGEMDEAYVSKGPFPRKASVQLGPASSLRQPNAVQDPIFNAYAAVTSANQSGSSLRQYAEQSLEDRQAALDEFMVQNLENSDFVKLCKDVENCWKRIALGL